MSKERRQGVRKFRITDAYGHYLAKTSRTALNPLIHATSKEDLFPRGLKGKQAKHQIMQRMRHVMLTWRKRLKVLATYDWEPVQEPVAYVRAANCPPVGVLTDQTGLMPCHRHTICPWCWCRHHVWPVYQRFEQVLFSDDDNPGRFQYDLIHVRTDRFYPDTEDWTARDVVNEFIKQDKGGYYKQRMTTALGGVVLCSLEPPRPRWRNRVWTVQHRILAIVHKDDTDDFYEEPDLGKFECDYGARAERHVERLRIPRRLALADVVGRYAEYPVLMMTGGVEKTLEVCSALAPPIVGTCDKPARGSRGARLSAMYGILRGKLKSAGDPDQLVTTTHR